MFETNFNTCKASHKDEMEFGELDNGHFFVDPEDAFDMQNPSRWAQKMEETGCENNAVDQDGDLLEYDPDKKIIPIILTVSDVRVGLEDW